MKHRPIFLTRLVYRHFAKYFGSVNKEFKFSQSIEHFWALRIIISNAYYDQQFSREVLS